VFKKKEDKVRFKEKFGIPSQKRPSEKLVWIHAVSVGETKSAMTLVDEILKSSSEISVLFTTTTVTSAKILSSKINGYKGKIIHQFLPLDSYFIVKKFLKFWHPEIIIFIESEIWLNFLCEAGKLGIPSFLVNARMSEKSFLRWNFAKKFGIKAFDFFDTIFAQSKIDEKKFSILARARSVRFCGNLKSQNLDLKFNSGDKKELQSQIGKRKVWLCASTHSGEEEIILNIHKKLKNIFPDILTIIVPRHSNRASEIKASMSNINFSQRSCFQEIMAETEVYLADTLGELNLFYSLCSFAFIGGSLVKAGGHNPFEAIYLKCAIITGGNVFNFQEIYDELDKKNAVVFAKKEDDLFFAVKDFLENENLVKNNSSKALNAVSSNENIAKNILSELKLSPKFLKKPCK
jgi:3-deoxy-D-manno-octulosonic-acid transferase